MSTEDEDRFRRVYQDAFESLLAYARRRVDQPADAADAVADPGQEVPERLTVRGKS